MSPEKSGEFVQLLQAIFCVVVVVVPLLLIGQGKVLFPRWRFNERQISRFRIASYVAAVVGAVLLASAIRRFAMFPG